MKPSDPGPPPTCPFIIITMSKSHPTLEADTYRSPLSLPGDKVSVYVGDRSSEWLESRRTAAVEWHIWAGVGPVKHFLQIYVRKFPRPPKRTDFSQKAPEAGRRLALWTRPRSTERAPIRSNHAQRRSHSKDSPPSSRAITRSGYTPASPRPRPRCDPCGT